MTAQGLQGDSLIPAGGRSLVREVSLLDGMVGTATYDYSRVYRYRLSRVWDPSGKRCLFVMLNPSTATETVLDPTVTRTYRWARDWGFGSLEVVNIFALRSTNPTQLRAVPDPIGPANDRAISDAVACADLCVAAWGVHGELGSRGQKVAELISGAGHRIHALGETKDGHPRHPLYLKRSSTPSIWRGYA